MKKIVIPAILAATILIGMTFAILPVQQATTVHTTIQAGQITIQEIATTATGFNPGDPAITLTINPSSDYKVSAIDCTTDANDDNWAIFTAKIGGREVDTVLADPGAGDADFDIILRAETLVGNDDDNLVVTGDLAIVTADDTDTLDCTVVIETTPGATVTAVWA